MAGWIVYDADGLTLSIPWIAVLIGWLLVLILFLWSLRPSHKGGSDFPGFKRLVRDNYVEAIFAVAALVVVWALWIGLWQVPNHVSELLASLTKSVADDNADQTRAAIVALAAVLGGVAVIGTLVVQAIRVWINERTTRTAEENLTTGLINKAVEGLGTEKSVSMFWRVVRYELDGVERSTFGTQTELPDIPLGAVETSRGEWQAGARTVPNMEVRLGAIYALERIAQDSDRDHVRVMEILCAYIRENAPGSTATDFDLGDWPDRPETLSEKERLARAALLQERAIRRREWARNLSRPRTDILAALEVIGRRSPRQKEIEREHRRGESRAPYRLDLRDTNLQRTSFLGLDLADARLENARLEGADFRGARLERASLAGAGLEYAILLEVPMLGADFGSARCEGANFGETKGCIINGAHLQEANLAGASIEDADFSNVKPARIENAYFCGADLRAANLRNGWFEGLNFGEAHLEEASLIGARLDRAGLEQVHLDGADLRGARLREANFSGARPRMANFEKADLRGAKLFSTANWESPVHSADLRTIHVPKQADLEGLIGNDDTLLPDGLNENGEHFYVWSCWETPPQGFDGLIERTSQVGLESADELRARYLCIPGNPRRKVGTPLALDAPYPDGHPLAPPPPTRAPLAPPPRIAQ